MTTTTLSRALSGLLAAGAVTLSGSSWAASSTETPALSVRDQCESFGSVTVRNVDVPEDSFVVLHDRSASDDSGRGPVVGKAFVEAGHHAKVSIELDPEVHQGDQLTAMLHQDTATQYTFENADNPNLDRPVTYQGHQVAGNFTITDVKGSADSVTG